MKTDFECPDEESLYAYISGNADRTVIEKVEKHIIECDRCLRTVVSCFELLEKFPDTGQIEVPAALKNRVFETIFNDEPINTLKKWKQIWKGFCDTVLNFLSPGEEECVYVRGDKKVISNNLVILEKVFREIKLQIEVEKTGYLKSNIKVSVRNPDSVEEQAEVRIDVMENTKELASFMTMKGEALFEDLPFGRYTVKASRNGKKLGEVLLKIEE
ncbi:MAG TPA: hypothetical protein ENN58_03140 [bacterium]|nr:hypothetical protein [bacterium]